MRFNKQFIYKTALFSIACTFFLVINSCQQQGGGNSNNQADSLKNAQKEGGYLESVYYRFPTPNEVFGFINNEKLKFDPSILNPSTEVDKYMSSKSQTLNLGVYIADLTYVSMFEAYDKSTDYYKSIHTLSEKIRITSAYDLEVAKRIEKNLLNLDSLKRISIDSYSSMVEYLIVNNREKTLALIAAGAYVECFNVAFSLSGTYSENNPMVAKIADLKYAFDNLYSYLQIYSDDPSVKEVAEQYQALSILFSKMEQKSLGKTTATKEADGNIVLGGGVKLSFTKPLFEEFKKEIFKLRKSIVTTY